MGIPEYGQGRSDGRLVGGLAPIRTFPLRGKGHLVEIVEGAVCLMELKQVHIGAGECGRAERGDDGDLVGGVVDGAQAVQQVADLLRVEKQRRAFQPVGDIRIVECQLQRAQGGASGHQDADIRVGGVLVAFVATVVQRSLGIENLPLLADDLVEQHRNAVGFNAARNVYLAFHFIAY